MKQRSKSMLIHSRLGMIAQEWGKLSGEESLIVVLFFSFLDEDLSSKVHRFL